MRRHLISCKFLAVLAATSLLAGCGFQLRGESQLPFTSAYVDAPAGSALGDGLRQSLSSLKKLTEKRDGAPVVIKIAKETRNKNILSLSGSGKVREYRLEYQVELTAFAAAGTELIAPDQIRQSREFSYNDDQVLAKESEEAALNRSMEQDALRQTLRRLSYLKP
jgi:LPS-assembly lipoprotein